MPRRSRGMVEWLRRNLFSSWLNSLVTVLLLYLLYRLSASVIDWLVIRAQWSGSGPEGCRGTAGACWPFVWTRLGQFVYGLYPGAERWRVNLGLVLGVAVAATLFAPRMRRAGGMRAGIVAAYLLLATYLLVGGGVLPVVETRHWGGLFLNVVVSVAVLAAGLPMGVLLALGRRSELPLASAFCIGWIEFWRSVPVVVVLFVAIILFPLFLPAGTEIDPLLRAVIVLAIMMSCFLAEALRGALETIPAGQYEASAALGLGYWNQLRLVILPQAFRVAMPQIVSNFIGLFKETTVLLIIGFHDLLGMVQAASNDPHWSGTQVRATGYAFAALCFWLCCVAISRLGARLERRLSP